MESLGENLDELSEVNTFVCDVIEDSLVAVALVFHVTDFHLQSEVFSYLSAFNHGVVFPGLSLPVLIHVDGSCNSVYPLDIVSRLEVSLFNLFFHEASSECHYADVVSWVSLNRHDVSLFKFEIVGVVVVSLSGMLELHLHQVCGVSIARHVSQPVVGVELFVLSADGIFAKPSVAVAAYSYFVVFIHRTLIYME